MVETRVKLVWTTPEVEDRDNYVSAYAFMLDRLFVLLYDKDSGVLSICSNEDRSCDRKKVIFSEKTDNLFPSTVKRFLDWAARMYSDIAA